MNSPKEMNEEEVLRAELAVFRREHRELDEAIKALQANPAGDQFLLTRLKKRKLALKDRITQIEDRLTPDIIA